MSTGIVSSSREVSRLVKRCLEEGSTVEIDGLGIFKPDGKGAFEFISASRPKVFLAYAAEDEPAVSALYDALKQVRFDPWMDCKKLMPGQNWARAIERAIDVSHYFIACLSGRSASRRGYFHAEMRHAMQCAQRMPLGEIFLIPARLEECPVPVEIMREIQYVDLFPNWKKGIDRIAAVMRQQERERARNSPQAAA
jgi:hypothetical protein